MARLRRGQLALYRESFGPVSDGAKQTFIDVHHAASNTGPTGHFARFLRDGPGPVPIRGFHTGRRL